MSLQRELYKKSKFPRDYAGNGTLYVLEDIIGESEVIKELKYKAKKIADSSSPVLVYGETGTGKELLVQGIHNASSIRKNKPFIAQNCAAIPKSLLEGILFGTTLGSFTGAKNKPGLFELADGGTLFLDEINSMDVELQAKLLRVLQDGVIRRIGGRKAINVDVRVIASTNEDPLDAVKKGILREDLNYRLNVISLRVPPLRERREDIPILVDYFIRMYNDKLCKNVYGVSTDCMKIFLDYPWPGNVRELKYTIESIMNFIDDGIIKVNDLPYNILNYSVCPKKQREKRQESREELPSLNEALRLYEKALIEKAIEKANGNCAKAARLLKVPRQTLYNKIKKYKIKWRLKIE